MEEKFEFITHEYLNEQYTHEIIEDTRVDFVVLPNISESSSSYHNKEKESLSDLVMIVYSLPAFGKMSCLVLLNIHAMIYYESIGASLLYLSFFVALARACEIILKPIIAHLSDITKTYLGRRKPYMLLGSGFYALFMILLFYPPSMKTGATNISIWFGVFYVLFFIADTVTNVPYLALGPELSTNTKERERLYIWFYLFQYLGVLFASAAPVLLNKISSPCDCSLCFNSSLINDPIKCVKQCKIICGVKHNQSSLLFMSLFIGFFYIVTVILLSVRIKERKHKVNKTSFIPSLEMLISNKPFRALLVPWVIDVLISTIFAAMLPFFLNFVINPQHYCIKNDIDLNQTECSVSFWLGASISIFFIFCIGFMFIWHHLVERFGKKVCWKAYSIISLFTFSLFLLCKEGSVGILIFASVLCAIPAGGAYLNDVFVADVIDYDEFLSGQRNEGVYTVFAAFIPKVVAIFAQSIPLTIMSLLGFVSSDRGETFEQPIEVVNFIRFFFLGVPCILAGISFFYKTKYPIADNGMVNEIRRTINIQKECAMLIKRKCDYYKIKDPVYGHYHMNVFVHNEFQRSTKKIFDHFHDFDFLKRIYTMDFEMLKAKMKTNLCLSLLLLISSGFLLFFTFPFLQYKSLSLIPLTSLFAISISIAILCISGMRYRIIQKVMEGEYKIDMKFFKLLVLNKMYNELKDGDINYHIKLKN